MTKSKEPFIGSFFRSQAASFASSMTDFLTFLFLTEVVGLWYIASNVISSLLGAIVSFTLGRNWAFKKTDVRKRGQIFRYAITSISSLILNTAGLYMMTEWGGLHYFYSKVFVSLIIGVTFNFLMFRYFVFR